MENLCNCGSSFQYVKEGRFFCSECQKPSGTLFSDLKPISYNDEDLLKLVRKVNLSYEELGKNKQNNAIS